MLFLFSLAHAQSSTPTAQTHKTLVHATWNASVQQLVGITPDQFRSMGLGSLTAKQFDDLLRWVNVRQQNKEQPQHLT
jgi:hypothetical protein